MASLDGEPGQVLTIDEDVAKRAAKAVGAGLDPCDAVGLGDLSLNEFGRDVAPARL